MRENTRFVGAEEVLIQPHATLPLQKQIAASCSEFGNVFYTSQKLSYPDNYGQAHRFGILISPDGRALLKDYPGLLTAIYTELPAVIRGGKLAGGYLTHIINEGQSTVSRLSLGDATMILKVHSPVGKPQSITSQPYINEMLQTQYLHKDLNALFTELNMNLQTFYFATGQLACVADEGNSYPTDDEIFNKACQLEDQTGRYIKWELEKGNELWRGIHPEALLRSDPAYAKRDNFIKKQDGTIIWIDPFRWQA